MRGVVRRWVAEKGFGFVAGEDGADYFLHVSEVIEGRAALAYGVTVEFDVLRTPKGPRAISVRVVEPAAVNHQEQGTEVQR